MKNVGAGFLRVHAVTVLMTFAAVCVVQAEDVLPIYEVSVADDVALLPRNTEAAKHYTLYSAKSVVGAPVLSEALRSAHWHLQPAADGKSCELYYEAGTLIYFR